MVGLAIPAAAAAWVTAVYLRVLPLGLCGIAVLILELLALEACLRVRPKMRKGVVTALAAFSLAFSAAIVVGKHIHVLGSSIYTDTIESSYIEPYALADLGALFVITAVVMLLSYALYSVVLCPQGKRQLTAHDSDVSPKRGSWWRKASDEAFDVQSIDKRVFLGCFVIMIACWAPYLLAYWPGFAFMDVDWTLQQVLGQVAYSNQQPLALLSFTIALKVCYKICAMFGGDLTQACGLYCMLQMTFMSLCFSWQFSLLVRRLQLRSWIALLLSLVFGALSYIATYSIALWKDPVFSVALMTASVMLIDFAITRGTCIRTWRWFVMFFIVDVITSLFRNNGFYISIFLAVVLFVMVVAETKKKRGKHVGEFSSDRLNALTKRLFATVGAAVLVSFIVLVPVYKIIGVAPSPPAENYAIPLAQMARVAALDGSMSESDAAYMNEMLPLDEYAAKYRPACIDRLKWDEEFNASVITGGRFFSHWVSMLVRNPGIYVDAWVMQTFGYWTVNVPAAYEYNSNITGGMPANLSSDASMKITLDYQNIFGTDAASTMLPVLANSVPCGIIVWALIYLVVVLLLSRHQLWLLGLIPALGLIGTLLIASPIWYWPRYIAAVQFLIPTFLGMFYALARQSRLRGKPSKD